MTGLTERQRAAILAQLEGANPATDALLESFASSIYQRAHHEHPKWEDFFCLNLSSYMGERAAPVLRRLLDAEAEVERLRASATGAHRRIEEVLDYLATKDAVKLSEDAGAMGFHIVAVLDGPARTAAEAAEDDAARRAKVLREAARLLEATGRDDDAVNLLDNMADAHQSGGTAAEPYRSQMLPPRDAICAGDDCGHNGAEHHHEGTACWAHLPRLREANGTWSGIRICPCKAFVPSGGAS